MKLPIRQSGPAVLVILTGLACVWYVLRLITPSPAPAPAAKAEPPGLVRLKAELARWDATLWAPEVLAQQHEDVIVALWDALRNSTQSFDTLIAFPLEQVTVGRPGAIRPLARGITESALTNTPATFAAAAWREWLADWRQRGVRIIQTEWHHARFEPPAAAPARSVVSVEFDLADAAGTTLWQITGELRIHWAAAKAGAPPRVASVDGTGLVLRTRSGPPAFRPAVTLGGEHSKQPSLVEPVLAHDFNGDGLSELVTPSQNVAYINEGRFRFRPVRLFQEPPSPGPNAGVIADFNRDGLADLAVAGAGWGVLLYRGKPDGGFHEPPLQVLRVEAGIFIPSVMTAGDVDDDGYPDLFLAQYKIPYQGGQMPTPYYDANDGYPAFLLLNRDQGSRFEDATEAAGLAARRHRRTYSASLVDLDDDDRLDLLVVSDFSGVDVYRNDGRGRFTDMNSQWLGDRSLFGMSHLFGDFNRDGRLDFYVTGMGSTTARRLEALGLRREDFRAHTDMRMRMGYGNRMYLASAGERRFTGPPWQDAVARSGWSWGCTTLDVANDGRTDIYVANGHISGDSAKDYCTTYWTRDIYLGNSRVNPLLEDLIVPGMPESAGISWNGFEHNVLFQDEGDGRYTKIGFLLDLGFEFDSRGVLGDDFDGDGRMDLAVVELRRLGPNAGDAALLHLLRNEWPAGHHWLGVRLRDHPRHSPIGARITLETSAGPRIARITNGDSYRTQHALAKHFGLGTNTVKTLEVRWRDGTVTRIDHPPLNRWHAIAPPGG